MSHGKCSGCGNGYSVFSKEMECASCRLSFCSKCTAHKIAVPKKGGEVGNVCQRCFLILTGKIKEADQRPPSPPASFQRELEARSAREFRHSHSGARSSQPPAPNSDLRADYRAPKLKPQYRGMSEDDMALEERLLKLKEDRKELEGIKASNLPPEVEIEQRLAKLRGDERTDDTTPNNPSTGTAQPHSRRPQLSQQQEIDMLLDEISEEISIERKAAGESTAPTIPPMAAASQADPSLTDQGEEADVYRLIQETAEQAEYDAQKYIAALKQDEGLWSQIKSLKNKGKADSASAEPRVTAEGGKSDADKAAQFTPGDMGSDEEVEEDQIKQVLVRIMEEKRLEEEFELATTIRQEQDGFTELPQVPSAVPGCDTPVHSTPPLPRRSASEELPWCCICNEDATVSCAECDGDLYCKRCFREGHKYELDHHPVKYRPI